MTALQKARPAFVFVSVLVVIWFTLAVYDSSKGQPIEIKDERENAQRQEDYETTIADAQKRHNEAEARIEDVRQKIVSFLDQNPDSLRETNTVMQEEYKSLVAEMSAAEQEREEVLEDILKLQHNH